MSGSVLRFATLVGALVLPGVIGYAPVALAGQPATQLSGPAGIVAPGIVPPGIANGGIVVLMRPVAADSQPKAGMGSLFGTMAGGLGVGKTSGSLASMLGSGTGSGPTGSASGTPAPHPWAVEFTLRMGDGSKQTVVQSDDLGLHPGDRVRVIRGDPTRLVRAG
jgi:outer membrane lipoprotein SlyB